MLSDTVKNVVLFLVKIQVFIIISYLILYTWCFGWTYIQANDLCSKVMLEMSSTNYISSELGEEIKEEIEFIYSRGNMGSTNITRPKMGIVNTTIRVYDENNKQIASRVVTARGMSGSPIKVQSGHHISVTVNFNYPTILFLFSTSQGNTGVDGLEGFYNNTEHYSEKADITSIAKVLKKEYNSSSVTKHTIGLKYYPDLEISESQLG